MKRILSYIVAFVMLMNMTTTAFATETEILSDTTIENATIEESSTEIVTEGNASQNEQADTEPLDSDDEVSLFGTSEVSDDDSPSTSELYLRFFDTLFGNRLNSAYAVNQSDAYVDTATGSMASNVTDLYIPGRNGLDIAINRTFNTASSPLMEYSSVEYSGSVPVALVKTFQYSYTENGTYKSGNVDILFNNELELLEAGTGFEGEISSSNNIFYKDIVDNNIKNCVYTCEDSTSYEKYFVEVSNKENTIDYTKNSDLRNLGQGWLLHYPNLALVEHYDEDYINSEGDYRQHRDVLLIFTDRLGNTHTADISLKKYNKYDKWNFMRGSVNSGYGHIVEFVNRGNLEITDIHPSGFEYNMTITDTNGDTYYFDGGSGGYKYYIVGISDRYGNVISIQQDEDTYSITDTYGVRYVCSNEGIKRIYNDTETELVKYDIQAVNSEQDINNKYEDDDEYILTVTKNSGTDNVISENEPNKTKYYMKQAYKYDKGLDSSRTWLKYSLPYRVEYPTGLTKYFEYEKKENWDIAYEINPVYGYYYTVSDYKEVGADETDIRNHTKYVYTINDIGKYEASQITHSVATAYTGENVTSICDTTYNTNQLPTYEKLTDADGKYYITDIYWYESGSPKGRIKSHNYCANTLDSDGTSQEYSHTTSYSYSGPRLIKETNGDYVCDYTYQNYNLPYTTIYNRDADTTIKIENLLTEDGKSIATQNTYENDILVNTVNYTYDAYGNVDSVSIPLDDTTSALTSYEYTYGEDGGYTVTATQSGIMNADGELQNDIVTSHTFDWRGNTVSATDAKGNVTTAEYDLLNRPIEKTNPDGTWESYTYDITNNATYANAQNGARYFSFSDEWGNVISASRSLSPTSPIETVMSAEYDALNRTGKIIRHYDNNNYTEALYTYDFNNRIMEEKIYDTTELIKTTSYAYSVDKDIDNRIVHITDTDISGDNGEYATHRQFTDYMGNVIKDSYMSGDDARTGTYTYDYVGNMLTSTDPAGNVTSYTYDYTNLPLSVTNAFGDTKTYTYNVLGLLTSESDFMGNITLYTYDTAGRALTSTMPFDEKGNSFAKTYYDANGNPTETYRKSNTTDEDDVYEKSINGYDCMNRLLYTAMYPTDDTPLYTQYIYDGDGNLSKKISGLTALLSEGDTIPEDAYCITYEYDNYGRLIRMTTPDGRYETYTYDYQDRLISDTDRGGYVANYIYDSFDNLLTKQKGNQYSSQKVDYEYNIAGQRISMSEDDTTSTTYTYDPFGRLTTETRGGIIKTSSYDIVGNRTSFAVTKDGSDILSSVYTYDALGRISTVVNGNNEISYTYDANSNQLTASLNGSVYQRNSYNRANLTTLVGSCHNGVLEDITRYTYTLNGNMRGSLNTKSGQSSLYYYDGIGRLMREMGWSDSFDYTHSYTYDNHGNRLSLAETDNETGETTTMSYTYNNMNQLVEFDDSEGKWDYLYDNNGNLISGTCCIPIIVEGVEYGDIVNSISYTYDLFNRLTQFSDYTYTAKYTYDGDNLRQTKQIGGDITTHIYDGANIVADISDTTTTYVRGNSLELINSPTSTTKAYIHSPRGDTAKLIAGDGTCIEYSYSAFGTKLTGEDYSYNPFGYCGEYQDLCSGLIYLRNRCYDPSIGRFITEDPARDGLNWYVYCRNNPIKYIDPTGYWATSDSKYSSTVQAMLLQLTVAWHMAPTDEQKTDISNRANEIRETVSSGFGAFLDKGKSITGAAADEFSWFLGGDVSGAERDYWLSEAQKYQSDIKIDDKTGLRSMMFIAGIISPSPDDAWRMISKKASKEMLETVGEKGAKKFIKSISKYAGAQGTNGIKKLQGSGIKGFMYEVKVKGVGGAYRLLGNKTESGEILWELFEKTH